MKRLYVKCTDCDHVFPSGFRAETATQVIGFFFVCPKCRRIIPCPSSKYLEKVNEEFQKSMKEEEIFALPLGSRIEVMGPDLFEFKGEVIVKKGAFLSSDRAIIRYRQEEK